MSTDDADYEEYEIEYTKVSKVVSEKPVTNKSATILTSSGGGDDGGEVTLDSSARRKKSSITQPAGIYMLYGKDLSEYDSIPVDEILAKLSPQELEQLSNEVDPDDSLLPPSQRCKDHTTKTPTGPLNRDQLIDYLTKYALEQEDWPENKRHVPGVRKGRVFVPKVQPSEPKDDIPIMLDLEGATESDLVDLAGILGLHSMLNQEQYYKSQKPGDKSDLGGFKTVVKSTPLKQLKPEPDNTTDPLQTIELLKNNDSTLDEVNLNNIKHITRDTFKNLFETLKTNTHLKKICLCNVGLTDGPCAVLVEVLKKNTTLRTISLESNFLSGLMIRNLIEAILENQTILEFRACNQRPQILGNRIEMDITKLVEKNSTLLRLGLNFDVPDARMRVAKHLQDNNDSIRLKRIGAIQPPEEG